MRTESSIASSELLKPITEVTKQVGTEVTKVAADTTKIAKQAKKKNGGNFTNYS